MNIFADLKTGKENIKITNPYDIYSALPRKPNSHEHLRHVQGEVLNEWYEHNKNKKDVVIKLNTGAGKTIVALLILQSSINDGLKRAVYVLPNKALMQQALEESKKIGISCVTDESSYEFHRGEAILITTVNKVFNGKSVFGVNDVKIPVDALLIDDAHACFETIKEQFTIQVSPDSEVYNEMWSLLSPSIAKQYPDKKESVDSGNETFLRIPFWALIDHKEEILGILNKHCNDKALQFKAPFVTSSLDSHDIVFTGNFMAICPAFLNVNCISAFKHAKRRVYTTATFADESVLVTDFGIDLDYSKNVIHPKKAGDIGDRMILTPNETFKDASEPVTKTFIFDLVNKLKERINILIIASSDLKAQEWIKETCGRKYLYDEISEIGTSKSGVSIIANKYDGIDLPHDKCRLIVVDGLPSFNSPKELIETNLLSDSYAFKKKVSYKIEQGMGRGIRSQSDWCGIVLWEEKKLSLLLSAEEYFSNATDAQVQLSRNLAKHIDSPQKMEEVLNMFIDRNKDWVDKSKEAVTGLEYSDSVTSYAWRIKDRAAYEKSLLGHYDEAIGLQSSAMNELTNSDDPSLYGVLQERLARYYYIKNDKENSKRILKKAQENNSLVCKPWHARVGSNLELKQAINIKNIFQEHPRNKINALIKSAETNLNFGEDYSFSKFEESMKDIGFLLGFTGSRPEKDNEKKGTQLDVLWQIEKNAILIPCKNQVTNDFVNRTELSQVLIDMEWVKSKISPDNMVTLIAHPSSKIHIDATLINAPVKILCAEQLNKIKSNVKFLFDKLNTGSLVTEMDIANFLNQNSLTFEGLYKNANTLED